MTGGTHHMRGKAGQAAPGARAAKKNGYFRCEGPGCNHRMVSYLNGGCSIHPFRDDWNKEHNPEARRRGIPKEKREKTRPRVTVNQQWNMQNPNHVQVVPKKAKKAKKANKQT